MITNFKENYWYRIVLHKFGIPSGFTENMLFMLDGKWHKCKSDYHDSCQAKFYDQPRHNITHYWHQDKIEYEESDCPFKYGDKVVIVPAIKPFYFIGRKINAETCAVLECCCSSSIGSFLIKDISFYKEPEPKIVEVTMKEVEEKFGYKVKIVNE